MKADGSHARAQSRHTVYFSTYFSLVVLNTIQPASEESYGERVGKVEEISGRI